MSQQEEDDRDVELQREIQQAFQEFLDAVEADRLKARLHHMELLKQFRARVMNHEPKRAAR
jgi:hypothetical protein